MCIELAANNTAKLEPFFDFGDLQFFTAQQQRPAYAVGSHRKQTLADELPRQCEVVSFCFGCLDVVSRLLVNARSKSDFCDCHHCFVLACVERDTLCAISVTF